MPTRSAPPSHRHAAPGHGRQVALQAGDRRETCKSMIDTDSIGDGNPTGVGAVSHSGVKTGAPRRNLHPVRNLPYVI